MSTTEHTYQIEEREDGALVATVTVPGRITPLQVGIARGSARNWVVILWDENAGSADFVVEDRATALQVLDFHAALVARLVAAPAVTA